MVAALAPVLRGQRGRNAGDNDDTTKHLSGAERSRVGIWLGLRVRSKPDANTGTRSGWFVDERIARFCLTKPGNFRSLRTVDNRYSRWQGLAIAQLSVAIALISGLSVAGLGAGLSLIQNDKFVLNGWWKCAFTSSQVFLIVAALLSVAAVISRTLDFRLTARSIQKGKDAGYDKSLRIFGCDEDGYGRATWRLFWASCACFLVGGMLLIASIATAYGDKLH